MINLPSPRINSILLLYFVLSVTACTTVPVKTAQQKQQEIQRENYQVTKESFNEIKLQLKRGEHQLAYQQLDDLVKKYPYNKFTKHAKILVIHDYYEQQEFETAIDQATDFIKKHPSHPNLDYVYYIRAISSFSLIKPSFENINTSREPKFDIDRTRETFSYFSVLATKFPEGGYFNDAIKKVVKLRNIMAEYEVKQAKKQYKKGHYQQVVTRIDYVIENYPRATIMGTALRVQLEAYRNLGVDWKVTELERRIKQSYSFAP